MTEFVIDGGRTLVHSWDDTGSVHKSLDMAGTEVADADTVSSLKFAAFSPSAGLTSESCPVL